MPTPIEIEIEGKTYKGSYETDGHLLTTRYRMQAMTDEVRSTKASSKMLNDVKCVLEHVTGEPTAASAMSSPASSPPSKLLSTPSISHYPSVWL